MAPLGFMSRRFLDRLGGVDQRYVAGQYENDFVMRAVADGGRVYKYEEVCVNIDHIIKHGNTTKFWSGYEEDRKVLEGSWVIGGWKPMPTPFLGLLPTQQTQNAFWYYPIINNEVTLVRQDLFVPFEDTDILTKSQGNKGVWE